LPYIDKLSTVITCFGVISVYLTWFCLSFVFVDFIGVYLVHSEQSNTLSWIKGRISGENFANEIHKFHQNLIPQESIEAILVFTVR